MERCFGELPFGAVFSFDSVTYVKVPVFECQDEGHYIRFNAVEVNNSAATSFEFFNSNTNIRFIV